MDHLNANIFLHWRDCAIYIGECFEPTMHRHLAVQCCISLSGKLEVFSTDSKQWKPCDAVVIGSNVPHRIRNADGLVCLVYLEKHSEDYKIISDHYRINSNGKIDCQPLLLYGDTPCQLVKKLVNLNPNNLDSTLASAIRFECLEFFNVHLLKQPVRDTRIIQLLQHLEQNPGSVFSGRQLATTINLSESRMQHLFKQQVGLPVRRYILWMKLRFVLERSLKGLSITEASYEAGFADSSHFSRTFKAMFGIAPSMFLSQRSNLQSLFCQ